MTVNCAALPPALIERELFGYEKGAFTGALQHTLGRFEVAHGGSLLLDEIGELPLEVQAKLLHVVQSGEPERLPDRPAAATGARKLGIERPRSPGTPEAGARGPRGSARKRGAGAALGARVQRGRGLRRPERNALKRRVPRARRS